MFAYDYTNACSFVSGQWALSPLIILLVDPAVQIMHRRTVEVVISVWWIPTNHLIGNKQTVMQFNLANDTARLTRWWSATQEPLKWWKSNTEPMRRWQIISYKDLAFRKCGYRVISGEQNIYIDEYFRKINRKCFFIPFGDHLLNCITTNHLIALVITNFRSPALR